MTDRKFPSLVTIVATVVCAVSLANVTSATPSPAPEHDNFPIIECGGKDGPARTSKRELRWLCLGYGELEIATLSSWRFEKHIIPTMRESETYNVLDERGFTKFTVNLGSAMVARPPGKEKIVKLNGNSAKEYFLNG